VAIGEEVTPEEGIVDEGLEDDVEKACGAEVADAPDGCAGVNDAHPTGGGDCSPSHLRAFAPCCRASSVSLSERLGR
jgi:hypothetical protein